MKKYILFLTLIACSLNFSQERKEIEAKRFKSPPIIDGILDDLQWNNLSPAKNFERWQPNNGSSEKKGYENFVYMGYDDDNIYFAGKFNNPNPIPVEFSQRDNIWEVNAETFFLSINPYDDNINYQGFQVTSAGTLGDTYTSEDITPEDWDFDTVFEAKVKINNDNWSMEMKIPYSALRFPSKKVQDWAINFGRKIVETGEVYTWNFVDQANKKYPESMGITKGIKDISPPLRLFFYPYGQTSVDFSKGNSPMNAYSAGMDVKYGINNSFTLDATLIPDFGQVTFDDKELNLSPFEQEFDENRAFFTEGASLFKKADGLGFRRGSFFYSRRIGDEISFNKDEYIKENESLINYDAKPELLNSIKITGTTNSKLSIGFINSITNKAYARFKNSNEEIRKQLIAPLTNYNVLLLSKQVLNDYSTISIANTNVNRGKDFDNANNTALIFDLFDSNRKYNFKAAVYQSNSKSFSKTKGFRGGIDINEITGNFRFGLGWTGVDAHYYQNDLGYYNNRNDQRLFSRIRYQTFESTKNFEKISAYLALSTRSRFYPKLLKSNGGRIGFDFTTKKLEEFEFDIDYTSEYKNFDEPRKENVYIIDPEEYEFSFAYMSDKRKKFTYGFDIQRSFAVNEDFDENKKGIKYGFGFLYRLNNKLNLQYEIGNSKNNDNVGYVFSEEDEIFFGKRDVKSIENDVSINYNFDSYKSINIKFRQFWSTAKYNDSFYSLNDNGKRNISNKDIEDYDPNTNFNLWNFDLGFNWEYAPGSKLTLLYRNNIFNQDNLSGISYYTSTKELFENPINHQLSIRINYFIDYNLLKRNKT
ncbi:MAG: DUF5916 domain-containing protein [Flavobacteriaceae bacterium]